MEIKFERITKEDNNVIFELFKSLVFKYENLKEIDVEKILKWEQRKLDERTSEYFSILFNGNKVGYVHIYENNGVTQLDDFYILEPYRNKGIGSMVLEDLLKSHSPVELVVFKENLIALNLYKKFGFVITQEISDTRVLMKFEK